jgi:hypothetical protein
LVPATSDTCDATTVTVQTVPAGNGAVGVNVNVVAGPGGDGLTENALGVAVGHSSLNAFAVTFTALLNETDGVTLASTAVSPLFGVVRVTLGGVSIVNEKVESAPSLVPATSETWAATTVTVHVVPAGRGAVGVNVNIVAGPGGDGLTENAAGVPVGHSSLNALAPTFTALSNVTDGVTPASTAVAPFCGAVLATVGGLSTVNENV